MEAPARPDIRAVSSSQAEDSVVENLHPSSVSDQVDFSPPGGQGRFTADTKLE